MIDRGVKARDLIGRRGIEKVGEVPLCWDCVIEIEVCEGRKRGERLGGAEGVDGDGLFRSRWDGRKEKGMRDESSTSKQAVSLVEEAEAVYNLEEANMPQARLPTGKRDYTTTRKPLGSSGINIRANASDPIDGEPIRVYPLKQRPKMPRSSHRGWPSHCFPMYRFSEPG